MFRRYCSDCRRTTICGVSTRQQARSSFKVDAAQFAVGALPSSKYRIVSAAASQVSPSGRMFETQLRLASVLPTRGAIDEIGAETVGRAEAGPFADEHQRQLRPQAVGRFHLRARRDRSGRRRSGRAASPSADEPWQQALQGAAATWRCTASAERPSLTTIASSGAVARSASALKSLGRMPRRAAGPSRAAAEYVCRSARRCSTTIVSTPSRRDFAGQLPPRRMRLMHRVARGGVGRLEIEPLAASASCRRLGRGQFERRRRVRSGCQASGVTSSFACS